MEVCVCGSRRWMDRSRGCEGCDVRLEGREEMLRRGNGDERDGSGEG